MAMFPAFLDIKGKKCVVVGAGRVAARKIDTLLKFEPQIVVISPEVCDHVHQLECESKVSVVRKEYSNEDIENAYLVIAATDNQDVNGKVYLEAQSKGLLVNVADAPEKCTFVFPSVVIRDELVVGISTSGSFPALSKKAREMIESFLPEFYGSAINSLKFWRLRAEMEIQDNNKRSELINRILDEVLSYENNITNAQLDNRIEKIFEEYKHEESL